jgi:hypothetical protein
MTVGQGHVIAGLLSILIGILWQVMLTVSRILGTLRGINSGLGMIQGTLLWRAGITTCPARPTTKEETTP